MKEINNPDIMDIRVKGLFIGIEFNHNANKQHEGLKELGDLAMELMNSNKQMITNIIKNLNKRG